jgi:predicted MFS family arabinose efflux permease
MRQIPHHIQALLAALQFRNADPEALRSLDESEWHALLEFCDLAHLTFPLWRNSGDVLPPWVRKRIELNASDNAQRFERIKQIYSELATALDDAHVEYLVIKGFGQYPGYVEDPRLRMQSDIDLYCSSESIFRARDKLLTLGYEPREELEHRASDHLPAMARKTSWEWRGNAFDPDMPPSVELHFCLWNEHTARFVPKGLEMFWSRRVIRNLDDFSFPALDPVDNLGFSALHALRDVLSGDWVLHRIYEMARFLHTNIENRPFWTQWRDLHGESLRASEAICFSLAKDWFACDLPIEVEAEVKSLSPAIQQWLHAFNRSPLEGMFHPNKDGVWLHIALLESSRDKRAVLRDALAPLHIPTVDAPGQDVTRQGKRKKFWPSQRYAKYLFYVTSRVVYHGKTLVPTLWRGARWWLGTKKLGKEFWTFLATAFFLDFGMSVYFFLFNFYLVDCGFTNKQLGRVTSAMALGSLAGTLPAGLLAQRFGLRRTLFLCFAMLSSAAALRALVTAEPIELGLSFLAGAALSIWAVSLSPALAQLTTKDNRPFGFSLVFSAGIGIAALGGIVGGGLPGWLSKTALAVQTAHTNRVALLLSCGVIALGMWPLSRLTFVSAPAREKKSWVRNPFLFRFLPVIAIWSLVMNAFAPFFNVYFSQYIHMPIQKIGLVFAISQLSQVLAILFTPFIFRKFGLITGIIYMQIATAIALGALAGVRSTSTAAFAYVIYMAFQWMSEPGMYMLLMNKMAPSERSGASALNFLVMSLSQSFAAAAAGASFTRFGYPAVLSVTAVVALAAAALSRLLLGNDSPQHPGTASLVESQSINRSGQVESAQARQLKHDLPQERGVVDQISLP